MNGARGECVCVVCGMFLSMLHHRSKRDDEIAAQELQVTRGNKKKDVTVKKGIEKEQRQKKNLRGERMRETWKVDRKKSFS